MNELEIRANAMLAELGAQCDMLSKRCVALSAEVAMLRNKLAEKENEKAAAPAAD